MDDLARRFRFEAGRRQGLRYPQELRRLAVQYATSAGNGMSRREIAAALGLSELTLVRWLRGEVASGAALHEVVVVEQVGSSRPVLVMPSGVRVEGLSIREVVSVLEALG